MRRTKANFRIAGEVATLLGSAFQSSMRNRRFRFLQGMSSENRALMRNLPWGSHILAVGVSLKNTGPSRDRRIDHDMLCLTFTVSRKLPMKRIPEEWRIPAYLNFHHLDVRIVTDVVTGRAPVVAEALSSAGRMIGQAPEHAGTTTAIVTDEDGQRYALGCSHVLAPVGFDHVGAAVESPAGSLPDIVGKLFTWTKLAAGGTQNLDAALVKIADEVQTTPGFPGGIPAGKVVDNQDFLYKPIKMYRGTSGKWLKGVWTAANTTREIKYPGIGAVTFSGLVECEVTNAEGDSGAPVLVEQGNRPLAMNIAGDRRRKAYGVPLIHVLDKFSVTL